MVCYSHSRTHQASANVTASQDQIQNLNVDKYERCRTPCQLKHACLHPLSMLFLSTFSVELLCSCFRHSELLLLTCLIMPETCQGQLFWEASNIWQDTVVKSNGRKLQCACFAWIHQGPSSILLEHLDCFTWSQTEPRCTLILCKQYLLSKRVRMAIRHFL